MDEKGIIFESALGIRDKDGKYTENKTIYLPCDLNTFANNTNYDLQVNYSGSSEYKLKESEKTITVKLTT